MPQNVMLMQRLTDSVRMFVSPSLNSEKPFLYISRKLTGDPMLTFVESPALLPPEIAIDPRVQAEMERDLEQANLVPLEDCEDNDL
jgi:GTP-binding nuclear protein Ran